MSHAWVLWILVSAGAVHVGPRMGLVPAWLDFRNDLHRSPVTDARAVLQAGR